MAPVFDPSNLFAVMGLVAVVTGGLIMAAALENNGATVYIVGRRKEVLEKAAKEQAKLGKIIPIQGDVTSRGSLLSLVSIIEAQTGYINILKILWESTSEEFQKTFEVNVTAVHYTTVAFLDLLDKGNKHGGIPGVTSQVVTTISISGFRRDEKPSEVAYSTRKAANVRSNLIALGIYPSEMTARHGYDTNEVSPNVVPPKRLGTEQDMGGLILYLASQTGAYVNGNVSVTDGGRLGMLSATY
ncbi:NAD(P)-binding protein [Ramaria rubella]|nr:NAD(P)-binding protein [Ramaria rubella]